jgi:hypothetical protein
MGRKTTRIYASATLNGDTALTVAASLHEAVLNLGKEADREKRLALFDTLDISIERSSVDERTMADVLTNTHRIETWAIIQVSCEAVLLSSLTPVSETPTEPSPHVGGGGIAR